MVRESRKTQMHQLKTLIKMFHDRLQGTWTRAHWRGAKDSGETKTDALDRILVAKGEVAVCTFSVPLQNYYSYS